MMVFAIFDVKSETYGVPFFMRSEGEARRAFIDVANSDDTMICRHPDDFKLVKLCEFDERSGSFGIRAVESLGFASEYKRVKAPTVIGKVGS